MTIMAVELTKDHVFWWGTVLEGALGAAVGALVSVGIALLVLSRTRQNDRDRARYDAALVAAEAMAEAFLTLRRRLNASLTGLVVENGRADLAAACSAWADVMWIKAPALAREESFAPAFAQTFTLLLELREQADWIYATFRTVDQDGTLVLASPGKELAAGLDSALGIWIVGLVSMLNAFRAGKLLPPMPERPSIPRALVRDEP